MCDPFTLAATQFALGAASSVMGFVQASAQADAQEALYAQNLKNARTAAPNQYSALHLRTDQERVAASQKKTEAAIEGAKLRGTARTSAAEAGVTGLSVDALIGDLYASEGRYGQSVDANFEAQRQYLISEAKGVEAQAQNQINSVPRGQYPSFLSTLVGIGTAGLGAYNGYQSALLTQGQLARMRIT